MLDIKFIKENKAKVIEAAKNKNVEINLERLFELDLERKKIQARIDDLRGEKNRQAASLKSVKPDGDHGRPLPFACAAWRRQGLRRSAGSPF